MTVSPRISFGMIVLNGEPFLRYNLRALYPFAHEIIVVEGAAPGAANIATPDGHSRDETLRTLERFKADEDPDDKLIILTRDGFWEEKDAMSQAYAQRATGDYLWQVDVDEFYHPEDMQTILDLLRADPEMTAVSFETLFFWGAPHVRVDGWYLRRGDGVFHRLFKWGPGYQYVTHRPPTVHDEQGRDLRSLKWLKAETLQRRGIYLYHYSLLLPKQVREKSDYYQHAAWSQREGARLWAEEVYMQLKKPYRVHNVYQQPSWLSPFEGTPPPQVRQLWQDLTTGTLDVDLRPMMDAERLLQSRRYRLGRAFLRAYDHFDRRLVALNDARWRWIKRASRLKRRLLNQELPS